MWNVPFKSQEQKNHRPSQPPVPCPRTGHERTAPEPRSPAPCLVSHGRGRTHLSFTRATDPAHANVSKTTQSLLMLLHRITASSNKVHLHPERGPARPLLISESERCPGLPYLPSLPKTSQVCHSREAPPTLSSSPLDLLFCTLSLSGRRCQPFLRALAEVRNLPRKGLWSAGPPANIFISAFLQTPRNINKKQITKRLNNSIHRQGGEKNKDMLRRRAVPFFPGHPLDGRRAWGMFPPTQQSRCFCQSHGCN